MRSKNPHGWTAIILCISLACLAAASVALAQQQWPMFRFDELRTGTNPNEEDIYPGAALDPTTGKYTSGVPFTLHWPRRHKNALRQAEYIIENGLDVPDTLASGLFDYDWDDPSVEWLVIEPAYTPVKEWNQHSETFLISPAVKPKDPLDPTYTPWVAWARWYLPTDRPNVLFYRIYVWLPSPPPSEMLAKYATDLKDYTPTTQAHYTIHAVEKFIDASGSTKFKEVTAGVTLGQTSGGAWIQLGNQPFMLNSTPPTAPGDPPVSYVELTNVTDDYLRKFVVADAVKFVEATDFEQGEIYSSPAVWVGPTGFTIPTGTGSTELDKGIYVGKIFPVPKPGANVTETDENKLDFGHIECVTGWYLDMNGVRLAHQFYRWIYPYGVNQWAEKGPPDSPPNPPDKLAGRAPPGSLAATIMGPIWGGVYSSPVVFEHGGELRVCVAGADGQVYMLDAETGNLIWSGPGITVDNDPSGGGPDWKNVAAAPAYMALNPGDAFFGTGYERALVTTAGSGKPITWDIAAKNPLDRYYKIQVWLPPRKLNVNGDLVRRARSATYTVKYGSDTLTAVVDQNTEGWLTLPAPPDMAGSHRAYWEPKSVTLTNESVDPGDYDANGNGYEIVADVIRVVPERLSTITYSSPVVANNAVFVGDTGGRLWRLEINSTHISDGWTEWECWPAVATGKGDPDDPPVNSIAASPAVWGSGTNQRIVFGTTDASGTRGRFYSVSTDFDNPDPQIGWYEAVDPKDPSKKIHVEWNQPVTATMAIPKAGDLAGKAIVATVEGRIFWFDPAGGEAKQMFPTSLGEDIDKDPVGAFNFSSPTVRQSKPGDPPDGRRIYIGSSDGKLYAFDVKGSKSDPYLTKAWKRTETVSGSPVVIDAAANLLSPIQSSVACTGVVNQPAGDPGWWLFVGTMDGKMWWVKDGISRKPGDWEPAFVRGRAFWETEGDVLFSSPAVLTIESGVKPSTRTESWLFVGGSDGLVYAWSGAAVPEGWAGPDIEPYGSIGEEPGTQPGGGISGENPMANAWVEREPGSGFEIYDKCEPWLEYIECDGYSVNPNNIPDPTNPPAVCPNTKGLPVPPYGGVNTLAPAAKPWLKGHNYSEALIGTRVSVSDGVVRVEWGEVIRLIAWNLSGGETKGSVSSPRFTMTSAGQGQQAGSSHSYGANVTGMYNPYNPKEQEDKTAWPCTNNGCVRAKVPENCFDPRSHEWWDPIVEPDWVELRQMATDWPGGTKPPCYPDPANPSYPLDWQDFTKGYAKYMFILDSSSMAKPQTPGTAYTISFSYRGKKDIVEVDQKGNVVHKSVSFTATAIVPKPGSVTAKPADPTLWEPQPFGINNPLGITDGSNSLGWEAPLRDHVGRTFDDTSANGNLVRNAYKQVSLNLGDANHGLDSPPGVLGIMDRSSLGLGISRSTIDKFRLRPSDLRWGGGQDAVINLLSSDIPPLDPGVANISPDYPDIPSSRMTFIKESDNANPTYFATNLIPCTTDGSGNPDARKPVPDPVRTWVNVPKYQPANLSLDVFTRLRGYVSRTYAYVDSDNNSRADVGIYIFGRPRTYAEAYREFAEGLAVLPDFRMKAQEETLDIGAVPHGFGMNMGFSPWSASFNTWFKEFTVHNIGNVNLMSLSVARMPLYSQNVGLYDTNGNGYYDDSNGTYPLSGYGVASSLDSDFSVHTPEGFFPHNLKKPRPDADPVLLTVPDPTSNPPGAPVKPRVCAAVPVSQPVGTYASRIIVYADENENGKWDWQIGASGYGAGNPEAVADPSPTLMVRVRESRLTDGYTAGELPQVDPPDASRPPSGDIHPTAFRTLNAADGSAGDMHLFWSSNRYGSKASDGAWSPSPNDPWFIYYSKLQNDGGTQWQPDVSGTQWWTPVTSAQHIPPLSGSSWDDGWPVTSKGGLPGELIPSSVRHTNPSVAQDPLTGQTWLFWQGQATKVDANNYFRENRVFYTNVTEGVVDGQVYSFTQDYTMVKYGPRGLVYHDDPASSGSHPRMWVFWYGGDAGRFSMFYDYFVCTDNRDPAKDWKVWTPDVKLTTPSSLASVAEPVPTLRRINGTVYFDVVYAGVSKHGQNTDVYMTRYRPVYTDCDNCSGEPSNTECDSCTDKCTVRLNVQKLPRVGKRDEGEVETWERLQRDPDASVYYSRHIAWVAPSDDATDPDRPIVTVVLPSDSDSTKYVEYVVVNNNITKAYDDATKLYAFTYPVNDPDDKRAEKFGQVLLDTSAGTVRFANPLTPKALVRARYTPRTLRLNTSAELKADWIDFPSISAGVFSWRWTAEHASDGAPFAVLEKSPNLNFADLRNWPDCQTSGKQIVPIDRYWIFWRRPHSEVRATTIYYKTMRLGVQLSRPLKAKQNPPTAENIAVAGSTGPFEVTLGDIARGIGGRVYFTEADEGRKVTVTYDGLVGPYPYTVQTFTETAYVTWIDELPETALLGDQTTDMVNEGQVWAVPDPPYPACDDPTDRTRTQMWTPTSMWLFWTSTRSGSADLYYETVSPNFRAVLQKR